jgi:hypothetical protein
MKPNYTYNAYYQECFGETVMLLVDLGFGRSVPMVFRLCDVAPVDDKPMHWYIDTWMRENRRVQVESVRRDDHYAAHIYRGADCLNVALREAGYAVPA